MAQRILRPLSYGDLFDEMFYLYKKHFTLFAGITGVVYIPIYTLLFAFASAETASMVVSILLIPIQYVVIAATTWAVSQCYLGEPVTIKQAYQAIRSKWFGLLAVMIVAGILVGLGLLALIVPGVILAFRYAFLSEVCVLEGLTGKACRVRSAALAKGNVNRIFVVGLIAGLMMYVILMVLTFPFMMNAQSGSTPGGVLYGLAQAVAQTIVGPLHAMAFILLYYDIRVRKEGFDIQMLAQNMGKAVAAPEAQPAVVD